MANELASDSDDNAGVMGPGASANTLTAEQIEAVSDLGPVRGKSATSRACGVPYTQIYSQRRVLTGGKKQDLHRARGQQARRLEVSVFFSGAARDLPIHLN